LNAGWSKIGRRAVDKRIGAMMDRKLLKSLYFRRGFGLASRQKLDCRGFPQIMDGEDCATAVVSARISSGTRDANPKNKRCNSLKFPDSRKYGFGKISSAQTGARRISVASPDKR
jgi:hypothetical protein